MIHRGFLSGDSLPPFRREEILRYAGAKEKTPALSTLLEDTLKEAEQVISCQICWQEVPAALTESGVNFDGIACTAPSLRTHLEGCTRAVLFAATLGIGIDRLIARYGRTAPARALLLQAIGAERIEALCDAFFVRIQEQVLTRGLHTTTRFSPGYGDLPLSFQKEMFQMLDCPKNIGLTLNESLIMSPSKSVTAIIGIGPKCAHSSAGGCSQCAKTDCIYRRQP